MKTFLATDFYFKLFIYPGASGGMVLFEDAQPTWTEFTDRYTTGFISAGITPFLS